MPAEKRLAFIAGGGSGIGRAAAILLARAGFDIAIGDRDISAAESAAAEASSLGAAVLPVGCDVTSQALVDTAVSSVDRRFGRIDVLVTAAGTTLHEGVQTTTLDAWNRTLEINLTGTFLCVQAVIPTMLRNGFGRVICVGSSSGVFGMGYPAYSASKAGVLGFARSVAREFARKGITANVVVPGPTETPLTTGIWQKDPDHRQRVLAALPVGRIGSSDEVASAICYLAQDNAGYVTGTEIVVDGGITSLLAPDMRG